MPRIAAKPVVCVGLIVVLLGGIAAIRALIEPTSPAEKQVPETRRAPTTTFVSSQEAIKLADALRHASSKSAVSRSGFKTLRDWGYQRDLFRGSWLADTLLALETVVSEGLEPSVELAEYLDGNTEVYLGCVALIRDGVSPRASAESKTDWFALQQIVLGTLATQSLRPEECLALLCAMWVLEGESFYAAVFGYKLEVAIASYGWLRFGADWSVALAEVGVGRPGLDWVAERNVASMCAEDLTSPLCEWAQAWLELLQNHSATSGALSDAMSAAESSPAFQPLPVAIFWSFGRERVWASANGWGRPAWGKPN